MNKSHSLQYVSLKNSLEQIRQQISHQEKGILLEPYSAKKNRVRIYQVIFALMGVIFFSLLYFTLYGNPHSLIIQHMHNAPWINLFMTSLSALFGSLSLLFAWSLKVEKDVMNDMLHQSKNKLFRLHAMKKTEQTLRKYLPYTLCYRNTLKLKNRLHNTLERLELAKQEFSLLLKKISHNSSLPSKMRESLMNQALREFREYADSIVEEFETFEETTLSVSPVESQTA